ncbi:hypothetical protein VCRA2122O265_170041 [Vibrio crassostreae]|nr:hypothetical protein VCRA2113O224_110066 [Vibrio crassostreae]CAK1714468.1 hypothetical protein VCRA2113O200_110069 [Vibrio crassostreae]CAK1716577.1 hypothetical protein VCRA2112O192_110088 [Vibrio crassostreae]CAK1740540.1 hypothetical protein VCRA2118O236_130067 [Vibrio crassostreae]CAK1748287.1 hypothetical protein VCRA2118O144_130042 [Vibrio crassostreae]
MATFRLLKRTSGKLFERIGRKATGLSTNILSMIAGPPLNRI